MLKRILDEKDDEGNLLTDRAVWNGPKCIDSDRNVREEIRFIQDIENDKKGPNN